MRFIFIVWVVFLRIPVWCLLMMDWLLMLLLLVLLLLVWRRDMVGVRNGRLNFKFVCFEGIRILRTRSSDTKMITKRKMNLDQSELYHDNLSMQHSPCWSQCKDVRRW